MKHVTASEARKNWFTLLDEAARGEVIAIQRNDKKLILKLQKKKPAAPSYKGLIDFPDADDADIWGWEWKGPGKLVSKVRRRSKRGANASPTRSASAIARSLNKRRSK